MDEGSHLFSKSGAGLFRLVRHGWEASCFGMRGSHADLDNHSIYIGYSASNPDAVLLPIHDKVV